jgi:transcriptional regulator with XRE-family HTH domain
MSPLQIIVLSILKRSQALGLSQTELALRAGVARESVSRLGKRDDADFKLLHKLAAAVGLQIQASPLDDLRLSFPYDWSNSAITVDALILNVLEREIFADVVEVCRYFGLPKVQALAVRKISESVSLARMLNNISRGFDLQAHLHV